MKTGPDHASTNSLIAVRVARVHRGSALSQITSSGLLRLSSLILFEAPASTKTCKNSSCQHNTSSRILPERHTDGPTQQLRAKGFLQSHQLRRSLRPRREGSTQPGQATTSINYDRPNLSDICMAFDSRLVKWSLAKTVSRVNICTLFNQDLKRSEMQLCCCSRHSCCGLPRLLFYDRSCRQNASPSFRFRLWHRFWLRCPEGPDHSRCRIRKTGFGKEFSFLFTSTI